MVLVLVNQLLVKMVVLEAAAMLEVLEQTAQAHLPKDITVALEMLQMVVITKVAVVGEQVLLVQLVYIT